MVLDEMMYGCNNFIRIMMLVITVFRTFAFE